MGRGEGVCPIDLGPLSTLCTYRITVLTHYPGELSSLSLVAFDPKKEIIRPQNSALRHFNRSLTEVASEVTLSMT